MTIPNYDTMICVCTKQCIGTRRYLCQQQTYINTIDVLTNINNERAMWNEVKHGISQEMKSTIVKITDIPVVLASIIEKMSRFNKHIAIFYKQTDMFEVSSYVEDKNGIWTQGFGYNSLPDTIKKEFETHVKAIPEHMRYVIHIGTSYNQMLLSDYKVWYPFKFE